MKNCDDSVANGDIKQIICVKWGNLYGPDYVNRLYSMVKRNITPPFRLICLTDNRNGIGADVECYDLPDLGVPHPKNTLGKWKKQVLWGESLPGVKGVALFIDLDSVIVDSIDPYFSFGKPDDIILARNWARPLSGMGQTSVFRYAIGSHPYILRNFMENPQGIADRFRYEQHYVTKSIKGGVKFWPERWTRHFRIHCLPMFPLRLFVEAKIPRGSRIITFPGGPNPDDVIAHRWNKNLQLPASFREYFMELWQNKNRNERIFRQLKRYFKPVSWLKRYWVE